MTWQCWSIHTCTARVATPDSNRTCAKLLCQVLMELWRHTWKWDGVIMRNTTWCCSISCRAMLGFLMSSAGATTMPQPMLSGSQMSMTLPSKMKGMVWKNMEPGASGVVAVR